MKFIRICLFILFNIAFAVALFFLFTWLNNLQVRADAQNKEYAIGETIPFDDVTVIVTAIDVTPHTAPPETIEDPLAAFGGYRTPEDCTFIKPIRSYGDCIDRNRKRGLIKNNLLKYDRDRLTIHYTIESVQNNAPTQPNVDVSIETTPSRDMKEPITIIEGLTFIPYGTSELQAKDNSKQVDYQLWTDLKNDSGAYSNGEDSALLTFTYKDTTRKLPIVVTDVAQKS